MSTSRDHVLVTVAIVGLALGCFALGGFLADARARNRDTETRLAAIEQRLGLAQAAAAQAQRAEQAAPNAAAPQDAPSAPVQVDVARAPSLGPANAPVTLVAFTDLQCPFCARVMPALEQVHQKYGDRVRIAFKHFPLPIHAQAMLAHQAAIAAGRQGKFWEMADLIFADQQALDRAALVARAKKLGLDRAKFEAALDDPASAAEIRADVAEGSRVGVSGTPSFVLDGQLFSGLQPYDTFAARIDQALAAHQVRAGAPAAVGGR